MEYNELIVKFRYRKDNQSDACFLCSYRTKTMRETLDMYISAQENHIILYPEDDDPAFKDKEFHCGQIADMYLLLGTWETIPTLEIILE